jgi:hypothetical protein
MAQQAFGIAWNPGCERNRRQPAQGADVAGIRPEDVSKDLLGGPAVLGADAVARLLDVLPMRIAEPGALEGDLRIRILLEIDEQIAVRQPRRFQRWRPRQRMAQLFARGLEPSGLAVGARQIQPGMRKIRRSGDGPLQAVDGGVHLILRQQRRAEQAQALDLAGNGSLDRTQLALGRGGPTGAQRRQRLAVGGLESRGGRLCHEGWKSCTAKLRHRSYRAAARDSWRLPRSFGMTESVRGRVRQRTDAPTSLV